MSKYKFKGSTAVADKPKKVKKAKVEPEVIESIPQGVRLEAHCMKDKEAVVVCDGELVKTSNGRLMIRGIHKACKTKVSVFISRDKYDNAVKTVKKGKKK